MQDSGQATRAHSTRSVTRLTRVAHTVSPLQDQPVTRERRVKPTNGSIQHDLGLSNKDQYEDFYTLVSRIIQSQGFRNATFLGRLAKMKATKDILNAVTTNEAAARKFRDTVARLETALGQDAFQKMVYRICANARRRERHHLSQGTQKDGESAIHSRAEIPKRGGKDHTVIGAVSVDSVFDSTWETMVSITRKDGTHSAVSRLCELLRGYPWTRYSSSTRINDLDMEKFIEILESEHGFDRDIDCLAFDHQALNSRSIIGNQRQWLAVISDNLIKSEWLKFFVVPRPDLPISPIRNRVIQ